MSNLNIRSITLVLRKEWLELRQQRGLMLGMLALGLLFTVMPLGIIYIMGFTPTEELDEFDEMLETVELSPALRGLSPQELIQALMGQPVSVLALLLPIILSSIIASYSIVGEKLSRTLEPLLATPVTTAELLLAKILSALIPSMVMTWASAAVFVAGLEAAALSPRVFQVIVSPAWVLLLLLCAPLLAMISIAATVAISSRVNDARSAQQISAVVVVPILLIVGGQLTGLLVLSPIFVVLAALVLALIAAGATWIATRFFQREAILTRWT